MSMARPVTECLLQMVEEEHTLEDYQSEGQPRWCRGCGDHAILTAMQRLCRDENIPPEKAMFVSGIGCSSRLPHYMNAYGFHGLHGRALPVAEGIRIRRPDLHIFVTTGDGDCCSIGAAHWIHAVRYNMNLTVILHDNQIYGLTKKQASPTSPRGLKTNTSPRGAYLEPLNPLTVTLGIANVSFVAQAVDWIPDLLYEIIRQGHRHRGLAFIRVYQRCPAYLSTRFDDWLHDTARTQLLVHPNGIQVGPDIARVYRNQIEHDPGDIHRAREIASGLDPIPVGILYRDETVPCYDELRKPQVPNTAKTIKAALDKELDKFTIQATA
jgi:2-oxoglutarate ferredoxin oxidoreductase subunit beta